MNHELHAPARTAIAASSSSGQRQTVSSWNDCSWHDVSNRMRGFAEPETAVAADDPGYRPFEDSVRASRSRCATRGSRSRSRRSEDRNRPQERPKPDFDSWCMLAPPSRTQWVQTGESTSQLWHQYCEFLDDTEWVRREGDRNWGVRFCVEWRLGYSTSTAGAADALLADAISADTAVSTAVAADALRSSNSEDDNENSNSEDEPLLLPPSELFWPQRPEELSAEATWMKLQGGLRRRGFQMPELGVWSDTRAEQLIVWSMQTAVAASDWSQCPQDDWWYNFNGDREDPGFC